jgi:hypothetical protein
MSEVILWGLGRTCLRLGTASHSIIGADEAKITQNQAVECPQPISS